ncbi:MFS general substrate transporter [Mycena sanguinolenta]|uniref:MFS general substrate transporter n=1 Tax=Mycena sanguinolenta TaxID=230812 RepID=A0A8H6Z838_9AGAR|nr:MFS general substrate transporter [Mycena sanguinolenta]
MSTAPMGCTPKQVPQTHEPLSFTRREASDFFPNAQHFVINGGKFTSNITHMRPKDGTASSSFRRIPLGDVNLLSEIQVHSVSDTVARQFERGSVTRLLIRPLSRRTYSARVKGRKSDMTVAVYQGHNAEEEWRRDVDKYSGVRHPKFLQVYGVTGSSSLYATVFHDDLVSLQEIYWLCRRSSLATAYLDAYFGLELCDAEAYIHSISGTFLHHGSYTLWMRRSSGRLCVDLSPNTFERPLLPAVLPGEVPHIPIPPLPRDQDAAIIEGLTLRQHLEIIDHCHRISLWSSDFLLVVSQVKLGALLYISSDFEHPVKIASPPACQFEDSGWKLRFRGSFSPAKPMCMKNGWTRFNYSSVKTTGMATREIQSPHVAIDWLSQANYILSGLGIISDFEHYRIVHGIDYWLSFTATSKVSPKGGYLFLCPLAHLGSPDGSFRPPSVAAYWSLDPSGIQRLTPQKAEMLGFPHVEFKMKVWTRTWDESVYAGLRQFHGGKRFDPDSQDVARLIGLPLYESSWLEDNDADDVQIQLCSSDPFTYNKELEHPLIEAPEADRLESIPDSNLVVPDFGTVLRRHSIMLGCFTQAQMLCLLGGFGLIVILVFWVFPSLHLSGSNVISAAIRRAEMLESWLQDDALINFIEILKRDVRTAAVYNAIEGESLRMNWVRRQLGIND